MKYKLGSSGVDARGMKVDPREGTGGGKREIVHTSWAELVAAAKARQAKNAGRLP